MSEHWKVIPEKTQDHWLEIEDPEGWYSAIARFDGCVHFYHYGNIPLSSSPDRKDSACCDDYIHICDIDEMIERLQSLKKVAQEHFKGGEW